MMGPRVRSNVSDGAGRNAPLRGGNGNVNGSGGNAEAAVGLDGPCARAVLSALVLAVALPGLLMIAVALTWVRGLGAEGGASGIGAGGGGWAGAGLGTPQLRTKEAPAEGTHAAHVDATPATALINPPHEQLLTYRARAWEGENQVKCRFTSVLIEDVTFFDMRRGAYAEEWGPDRRRGHREHWRENSRTRHGAEFKESKSALLAQGKRSIGFMHLGKAGGTSVMCHIRAALPWGYHCPGFEYGHGKKPDGVEGFPLGNDTESEISKQVNCYVHYDAQLHCHDNDAILINIRNPIRRMASVFNYEHATNMKTQWKQRQITCGQHMLFKCYPYLNDMAEIGLAGPRPSPTRPLRIAQNIPEEECRHWAWAYTQGYQSGTFHNMYNLDWYSAPALEEGKEIFALRVEHLDQDWTTVDRILGGTGALPEQMHLNDANDNSKILIHNTTLSREGYLNMCKVMCEEIQVYKRVLTGAKNLQAVDVRASLDELDCPDDMDPAPRICPENGSMPP